MPIIPVEVTNEQLEGLQRIAAKLDTAWISWRMIPYAEDVLGPFAEQDDVIQLLDQAREMVSPTIKILAASRAVQPDTSAPDKGRNDE